MIERFKIRPIPNKEKILHAAYAFGNLIQITTFLFEPTGFESEVVNDAFKLVYTSFIPAVAGVISAEESVKYDRSRYHPSRFSQEKRRIVTTEVLNGVGAFLVNRGASMTAAGYIFNNPELRSVGLLSFFSGVGLFLVGEKIRQDGYLFRLNKAKRGV